MSALACLAKYEGAVQRCFHTLEYNAYGKYSLRLYHKPHNKWQTVVVDDWIPCDRKTSKPLFAKPNGDDGWVLLLEKAMAKFKGCYAALDGGSTLWALEALTGDVVFKFKGDGQLGPPGTTPSPSDAAAIIWRRFDLVHMPTTKAEGGYDMCLKDTKEVVLNADMFEVIQTYKRRESVIAASTGSGDHSKHTCGIVHGHAYTVQTVKEVEGFRLVKLRNPWGTFEWQGNWSDGSSMWQKYPKVAKALDFVPQNDGSFWMDWRDFTAYFRSLDFCCRTTGWDDLALDIHEECPVCGPTWGCVSGCACFWCGCKGLKAMFCGSKSRGFEKPEAGCCCAV
eukprot:jgi/Chrzof1/8125/UNPLg00170.t1